MKIRSVSGKHCIMAPSSERNYERITHTHTEPNLYKEIPGSFARHVVSITHNAHSWQSMRFPLSQDLAWPLLGCLVTWALSSRLCVISTPLLWCYRLSEESAAQWQNTEHSLGKRINIDTPLTLIIAILIAIYTFPTGWYKCSCSLRWKLQRENPTINGWIRIH